MGTYRSIIEHPAKLRSMTGLTADAFHALVPIFHDKASGLAIGDQSTPPQQSPKGITMIPVDSSMLHSVGYDEQTRCLQVVFNTGQMYCYKDVPPEVFQDLLQAESKGQYMRACIIDVY